jgi:hypothetical protein
MDVVSTLFSESVIRILQIGLAGLAFLFAVLAYLLLRSEQQKQKTNPSIVRAIIIFLGIQLAALVSVGAFTLLQPVMQPTGGITQNPVVEEHVATCRDSLDRSETMSRLPDTTEQGLRQSIRDTVAACLPTIRRLDEAPPQ